MNKENNEGWITFTNTGRKITASTDADTKRQRWYEFWTQGNTSDRKRKAETSSVKNKKDKKVGGKKHPKKSEKKRRR